MVYCSTETLEYSIKAEDAEVMKELREALWNIEGIVQDAPIFSEDGTLEGTARADNIDKHLAILRDVASRNLNAGITAELHYYTQGGK